MALKIFTFCLFILSFSSCGREQIRVAADGEVCEFTLIEQRQFSEDIVESIEKAAFVKSASYKAQNMLWMIGTVSNDTDEHINTDSLAENIQAKLIQSGIAQFIDSNWVDKIFSGKKSYQLNESELDQLLKQTGAKLLLRLRISGKRMKGTEKSSNAYLLTFQVVEAQTKQVLWAGELTSITCEKYFKKERESIYLKSRR